MIGSFVKWNLPVSIRNGRTLINIMSCESGSNDDKDMKKTYSAIGHSLSI